MISWQDPLKGRLPLTSMYNKTPRDQMSHFVPNFPSNVSGAEYDKFSEILWYYWFDFFSSLIARLNYINLTLS